MRQQGRGLRPLSTPTVGHGRAEARALLLEEITRNPTQSPNPVSYQTRRGRGLRSLSPPHTTFAFAPNTSGLGRARSRAPGPHQCPGPPVHCQFHALWFQGDFPRPHLWKLSQNPLY